MDAATLLARAREVNADVNRATVYRTLELLRKLRLADGRARPDFARLACVRCGRIEECANPLFEALKQVIGGECAFDVGTVRIDAVGRCRHCAERV